MKRYVCLMALCLHFLLAVAQQPVRSLLLGVANDKTTCLVFPFTIVHVDRGTPDLLVQQVEAAKKMLLIKGAAPNFKPTSLTVVTEDGAVYPFNVCYEAAPANTVFEYGVRTPLASPLSPGGDSSLNIRSFQRYTNAILSKRPWLAGMKDSKWGIGARVTGIYSTGDVLFFRVKVKNSSTVDYESELFRFYIKDKKAGKRTAAQEVELKPLFTYGDATRVKAGEEKTIVWAFEKFTIPDAKHLFIQITEINGGRHLRLKVTNGKIVRAQPLNGKL